MLEPPLPDAGCALFFDFDGTLAEIAPAPDAVVVDPRATGLLSTLASALCGAVAVVSGRTVADIDRLLDPLKLPAAGVHGAERRGHDGYLRRIAVGDLGPALALLAPFVQRHPGLLLERKPGSLALHYRQAPALEDACLSAMTDAMRHVEGMTLLRGKMIVELKPRRAGKGHAVRSFLDERPFRLRRPWFFGDDVTDEAAFEFVQACGGVAVKVGEGETLAAYRLAHPSALLGWMAGAAAALTPRATADR
ncbi:MAG: trehalose-phosphatase [Rubrivivax sp.]|jgi:trehalose 6-phosphate phosphatase|nr:trehalose-phosphatase [Rubrivivax sp.]